MQFQQTSGSARWCTLCGARPGIAGPAWICRVCVARPPAPPDLADVPLPDVVVAPRPNDRNARRERGACIGCGQPLDDPPFVKCVDCRQHAAALKRGRVKGTRRAPACKPRHVVRRQPAPPETDER